MPIHAGDLALFENSVAQGPQPAICSRPNCALTVFESGTRAEKPAICLSCHRVGEHDEFPLPKLSQPVGGGQPNAIAGSTGNRIDLVLGGVGTPQIGDKLARPQSCDPAASRAYPEIPFTVWNHATNVLCTRHPGRLVETRESPLLKPMKLNLAFGRNPDVSLQVLDQTFHTVISPGVARGEAA